MSISTAVTVAMLPDLFSEPYPRPFLYCTNCGAEDSAHAGDYWSIPPDYKFRCCRRNMLLVVRQESLIEYAASH